VLRQHVCLVRGNEFFAGTIAENVHVHRPGIGLREVRQALARVRLLEEILRLPKGLETEIVGDGNPLSDNQKTALLLARGLAGRPQLLLVDGVLDRLPDEELKHMLSTLEQLGEHCAMVIATGRRVVKEWCGRKLSLSPAGETPRSAESNPSRIQP
jgi:ABC-type bacteriocin/lantibiotic exporter with double-glycine peptidase domain